MRRVNLPLGQLTANQLNGTDSIVNGSGCITWHSTWETTGSAGASYSLWDRSKTRGGQELMYVTLSSGQSTRDPIFFHALPFVGSLHLVTESGAIGGVIVAWVDHVCDDVVRMRHIVEEGQLLAQAKELGLL